MLGLYIAPSLLATVPVSTEKTGHFNDINSNHSTVNLSKQSISCFRPFLYCINPHNTPSPDAAAEGSSADVLMYLLIVPSSDHLTFTSLSVSGGVSITPSLHSDKDCEWISRTCRRLIDHQMAYLPSYATSTPSRQRHPRSTASAASATASGVSPSMAVS